MSAEPETQQHLTLREAARRIGVHENTVRNWVKRGLVDPVQVPGSRYRRYRADDIDRVAHMQEVSSEKARRTEGTTELVDAGFLDSWAGTRQAQELLPEVVRRLIAGTRGVVGMRLPSRGGVALSGWDGLVEDSTGSPWVPAGSSAWEIGTGGDPERKADTEYLRRTDKPLEVEPSVTTFVFVTPRRWPRAPRWEAARQGEGRWRRVRVLAADDLAGWLTSQPAVHLWFSEEVGLRPLEVRTLSQWWHQFSGQTEPSLPPELLLAGRADAARRLRSQITSEGAAAVFVRGTSREEATAFIAAALETAEDGPVAALIATSPQGWARLSIASEHSILIPYIEDPQIAPAVGRGHHVIVPLPAVTGPSRQDVIEIGPLDRNAARDVFIQKAELSFGKADRLAGLARRSLASLLRDSELAAAPRSSPVWAQGERARLLACLVLAGEWAPTEPDQQVVAQIAGRDWRTVEDELVALSNSPDPPFVRAGGGWQVASPDGAWALLHHAIQPSDVSRFCEKAIEVLLEADPTLQLDQEERLLAGVRGIRRAFSSRLSEGVAQGLALLGAFNDEFSGHTAGRDYAEPAVRQLLQRANDDASALLWRSISRYLQLLAEAAPTEFLDAVDAGLAGHDPLLLKMFTDRDQGHALGVSSEHTGLLWALELLCWAPEHMSRAAAALARLAEIDPGGRLGNRPSSSLRSVFLPWIPQTSAPLESRLRVLDRLRSQHPGIAWSLEMAIMPTHHDVSSFTPRPRFRRWPTTDERAPLSEWLEAIAETATRAIEDAGHDPLRWSDLVAHVADLPAEQRERLLTALESLCAGSMADEPRLRLWQTLVQLVGRHREFPDARWSLEAEPLARLEAVAARIEPEDLVGRYARLFDWDAHLPGVDRHDFAARDQALSNARAEAIGQILATFGMQGLERLAQASKLPEHVGLSAAAVAPGQYFSEVRALLGRTDELGRFAHGWVARMAANNDPSWLDERAAEMPGWSVGTQIGFLLALGAPNSRVVALTNSLDGAVQRQYWERVHPFGVEEGSVHEIVERLLTHNRPWVAIDVLSLACHRPENENAPDLSVDQIITVLDQALANESADRGVASRAGYEVGQLLDYLERRRVGQDVLARFEWAFFRMLEHTRQPRALYRALSGDPELFVELVCRVYRAKNAPASTEGDEQTIAIAQNAWSVLHDWRRPPGLNDEGAIDGQHLRSWIRQARLQLADRDRADIGDHQIGQTLSGAPPGADGIWPAEEIRELVEDLASRNLESGLAIGVLNARGTTSRGVYDGGAQEWALAGQHRDWGEAVVDRWPRTGRLLLELADDYERHARREDADAHARANDL